jgi:hypothetical protein
MRLGVAYQMDVNGRNVRVGDKIPMYRITTVELKMGAFEEKQYREHMGELEPAPIATAQQLRRPIAVSLLTIVSRPCRLTSLTH